jgi:hypothetical protein
MFPDVEGSFSGESQGPGVQNPIISNPFSRIQSMAVGQRGGEIETVASELPEALLTFSKV